MREAYRDQEQEAYIGSVRFYKHVVMTVLALLILIPICVSIILGVKYHNLQKRFEEENNLVLQQAAQIFELQQALAGKQQQKQKQPSSEPAERETEKADVGQSSAAVDKGSWELVLVNDAHTLPYDYTVSLTSIDGKQSVDERILPMLQSMLKDAETKGYSFRVTSGYRDMERQQNLFLDMVNKMTESGISYKEAFYRAKQKIALPGKSEHQTGLAVDLVPNNKVSESTVEGSSPEMVWLRDNCKNYGFILRYPAGKSEITGVEYEPYCFRYVGQEAAALIMDKGITLEEYLGE